jgi:DNA-binding CsgD family transcriptional regulator
MGDEMRGREREWQSVLALLSGVRAGKSGTLLVEGEPGAGMSRLLAEAAAEADAMGIAQAAGNAEELGQVYLTLDEAPGPLPSDLDPRVQVLERLRADLSERMVTGPLLTTLDDLQWADPATLTALRTLHWQLSAHPIAWILARSSAERQGQTGFLFDILERYGATRIELGPLPDDEVARLVNDTLGAPPCQELLTLAAGAGGNPFLLTELLTGLREEGALEVAENQVRLLSAALPQRVRTAVRHRLDRLSGDARQLLETATALGRSFSPGDAAALLGSTPAALLPAFEEAMAARVLTVTPDKFAFRHELVRQAVAAAVPAPVRQALRDQVDANPPARTGTVTAGPLVTRSVTAWSAGRLGEGLELARQATLLTDDGDLPAHLTVAAMLIDVHRLEEAAAALHTARERVAALGRSAWDAHTAVLRARLHLAAGRLDDAVIEAEFALGAPSLGPLAESILSTVALRRGDLRLAARQLRVGAAGANPMSDPFPDLSPDPLVTPLPAPLSAPAPAAPASPEVAPYARVCEALVVAQVAEACDGPARAMESLAELYAGLPAQRWPLIGEPAAAAWLVRLALAVGDQGAATDVVKAAESLRHDNPDFPSLAAAASHARGLLDQDADALAFAAERAAAPWARACAAEDFGVLLAAEGRHDDAVRSLDLALSAHHATGSQRDEARIRRRLRDMGVRHRHWTYAERPLSGWESLTETERSVSLLVAQGWTNQQVADQMFISVHTVAFHLRHIFRKLGISSRVQLTRLAVEQGHRLDH